MMGAPTTEFAEFEEATAPANAAPKSPPAELGSDDGWRSIGEVARKVVERAAK